MNIQTVEYNDPHAPQQFFQSLKETGFAVISGHDIDHQLIDAVYDEWEKFFASKDKFNYTFKRDYKEVQDGYFPMDVAEKAKGVTALDIKEFYHYYPIARIPKGITEKTAQLRQAMLDMSKVLLSWLGDNLPDAVRQKLSMPLSKMIDERAQTLLRILHYPPLPKDIDPDSIRAAAHEDINLITLLVSATEPGLETLDLDGNWHAIPPMPHAIIVNTGDMIQEATGGYLTATKHRVVNPKGGATQQSRYSIPLFLHAKDEVKLSERHTGASYRRERFAELGLL